MDCKHKFTNWGRPFIHQWKGETSSGVVYDGVNTAQCRQCGYCGLVETRSVMNGVEDGTAFNDSEIVPIPGR